MSKKRPKSEMRKRSKKLDKDICRKCIESVGIYYSGNYDANWDRGIVFCCAKPCAISIYEPPPPICYFFLEYLLKNEPEKRIL